MMQWVENTIQDAQFAVRSWRRAPGFALTAIATLAIGIGANTAIFSIVSGVLLRPLPFADPGRLAQVKENIPPAEAGAVFSQDIEAWRAQSASVEAMVAYATTSRNVAGIDEPEQAPAVASERGLFQMLGV